MKKAVSRISSLVINFFMFCISFYFMLMSVAMTDYWERYPIYIPEFIMCIAFIVISLALPFAANFLLYRFWYKKSGMSKLWVAIPLAATYFLLLGLLLVFLFSIPEWWNSFTWAKNDFAEMFFIIGSAL